MTVRRYESRVPGPESRVKSRESSIVSAVSPIQRHYVDALGRQHDVPAATIDAITGAMGRGTNTSQSSSVGNTGDTLLVVTEGQSPEIGRAELRLEDGTSLTV